MQSSVMAKYSAIGQEVRDCGSGMARSNAKDRNYEHVEFGRMDSYMKIFPG